MTRDFFQIKNKLILVCFTLSGIQDLLLPKWEITYTYYLNYYWNIFLKEWAICCYATSPQTCSHVVCWAAARVSALKMFPIELSWLYLWAIIWSVFVLISWHSERKSKWCRLKSKLPFGHICPSDSLMNFQSLVLTLNFSNYIHVKINVNLKFLFY